VAIYSTFLQRAYDQLIHDICLQSLDVTFAVDRAGLVGADGPTHAGSFDLSYGRPIPNLIIMAPADEHECRCMLQTAYEHPGPAMVRYPRGSGPGAAAGSAGAELRIGEAEVRRRGREAALLAFGSLVSAALQAGEALDATVVNMRFVKPLDEGLLLDLVATHRLLVTIEENAVAGGAGSAVAESLAAHGVQARCVHLGLPDRFLDQASPDEQLASCGLDAAGIAAAVRKALGDPETDYRVREGSGHG
jgi:1-deoxy-D-xylulose-5-phosphate synthase